VKIAGNVRAFRLEVIDRIEAAIERIAEGVAATFGASVGCEFRRRYPPLVTHAREAAIAAGAAAAVVGESKVERNGLARTASEDFSFMLQAKPGAFIHLGGGDGDAHNPHYDFSDAILPIGASDFARLVEMTLPRR
jgi:metal-dependent amidase/aminoacylase/carboxypeptidase family protein